MQWLNKPCRQPADISQSVDASAIISKMITMLPHMKAITCRKYNQHCVREVLHIIYIYTIGMASNEMDVYGHARDIAPTNERSHDNPLYILCI